jgi:hypothetical protein
LRAIDRRNLTAISRFIAVGASVNMYDTIRPLRSTPLISCVYDGRVEIARLLIDNRVDVLAPDGLGRPPLYHAVRWEAMTRLLLDAGADIAATYGQCETILHGAAIHGTTETVRLILKAGANTEATNNRGETPLHIAAQVERADIAETLLKWGANVQATCRLGFTPLLHAITGDRTLAAAHRILHRAPRPDGRCWEGTEACVPSCLWAEDNHPIVDLLLDAGVNRLRSTDVNSSLLDWAASYVRRNKRSADFP